MLAIIIIGDEILSGQVSDENLPFMIQRFSRAGYAPREVRIIGDNVALISRTVQELLRSYTYVVTAGGVGPTHDDLTHAGVAAAFGVGLEAHPHMMRFLGATAGADLPPNVKRMAMLPRGSEVIAADDGHWPIIRKQNCFMLPGLPHALRDKIPRLVALLPRLSPAWDAAVYLNADEVLFADWLDELQRSHCEVSIGSYPVVHHPDFRTRITISATDPQAVGSVTAQIERYARDKNWHVRTQNPVSRGGVPDGA